MLHPIGIPVTWVDFFDRLDLMNWTDGMLLYSTNLLHFAAGTKVSIDLCPTDGLRGEIDSSNFVYIEWDGSTHPGYYYRRYSEDTRHPVDNISGDVDYGHFFIESDTLKFAPMLTNCGASSIDVKIELSIQHNGDVVYSDNTYTSISGYDHLHYTTLFEVPARSLSNLEEGVYTAILIAKANPGGESYVEHDRVVVNFYMKYLDLSSCPAKRDSGSFLDAPSARGMTGGIYELIK